MKISGIASQLAGYATQFAPHARNAGWGSVEYLFYPFLMLLATPIYVSTLGTTNFGLWALVMAITGLGGAANLGMGTAAMKYVSAYCGRGDIRGAQRVVEQTLAIAGAGGAAFALIVALMARWLA